MKTTSLILLILMLVSSCKMSPCNSYVHEARLEQRGWKVKDHRYESAYFVPKYGRTPKR